ncbi:MAG: GFA family protein [Gammaproteobacteria bacterium]|nr:GFA family protein [Gammaproteobacteria bacterium]
MSELIEANGSCLCGATGTNAKNVSKNVGACHCSMCRKWAGGPLLAVDCGTEVSFEGEENISVFDSSEWAERGFCNKCGSHLFYRLKDSKQYIMPVGLFEDDRMFVFDHQIFIDEKPSFYRFANETEDMTGAEVFAKYAPPSE